MTETTREAALKKMTVDELRKEVWSCYDEAIALAESRRDEASDGIASGATARRLLDVLDELARRAALAAPSGTPETDERITAALTKLSLLIDANDRGNSTAVRARAFEIRSLILRRHPLAPASRPVIPAAAVLSEQGYAVVDDGVGFGTEVPCRGANLFFNRDSAEEFAADQGGMVFDCLLIRADAVTVAPLVEEGE